MSHPLDQYVSICDAFARLLAPNAEVVLHDLKSNQIHHISNCFSKRRKGDDSLNDLKGVEMGEPIIGPYAKLNWNNRRLKSVSTILNDQRGRPIGLLCVNHDIEGYAGVLDQINAIVSFPDATLKADAILASDWREHVNRLLSKFTADRNVTLSGLNSDSVNQLIAYLSDEGIFEIRNATKYVADVLEMSRATLYNRLKKVRHQTDEGL